MLNKREAGLVTVSVIIGAVGIETIKLTYKFVKGLFKKEEPKA